MKKHYIVGKDTTTYRLVNSSPKMGEIVNMLVKNKPTFANTGRRFVGRLMFLRMPYGFQPMVQAMVDNKPLNVYYYPKQVGIEIKRDKYAMPRAGEIGGNWAARNNPYSVAAGEVKGSLKTAPQVEQMMSGAEGHSSLFGWGKCIGRGGRPTPCFGREKYSIHPDNFNMSGADGKAKPKMAWGVQAGQVYNTDPNALINPNQVIGGEIEGVEEAVSHEYYSNFDGKGVQAGQMFDYGAKGAINPYGLEAGVIEGNPLTAPESHSYMGGSHTPYVRSFRYPNLIHYTRASVNVEPELANYRDSIFSNMNNSVQHAPEGFDSIQAGQYFDWGAIGRKNPYGLEAGVIEGNPLTAPESYSYANGEDKQALTEEEMQALHKANDKKGGNFWDWLKSDDAKNLAKDSVGIAAALFNKQQQQQINQQTGGSGATTTPVNTPSKQDDDNANKKTILGMHPVTFGIVATGIVAAGIIAVVMLKKKN
jgi:hypothetical protein